MCYNNATCLVGFTDKGYKCVYQAGYKGEHCEKGEGYCTGSRNNRQGSKYFTVYSVILFTGKYSKSINGLELCLTKARINIHQHGIIFTYPLLSLKSATSSIGFNDLIN